MSHLRKDHRKKKSEIGDSVRNMKRNDRNNVLHSLKHLEDRIWMRLNANEELEYDPFSV